MRDVHIEDDDQLFGIRLVDDSSSVDSIPRHRVHGCYFEWKPDPNRRLLVLPRPRCW